MEIIEKIIKTVRDRGLKGKSIRGGIWLGAGIGFDRILRLGRNVILTRILAPEIFGVMAIIMAIDRLFEAFTEIGINKAIIQNIDGDKDTFLNGAWLLAFSRSVLLYGAAFAAAPWIASFYDNSELAPLIRFASLSILFNGSISPMSHVAIKQMNYKKVVAITQGGAAIGITVTIALSFILNNIWALVYGFVFESFCRLILSYLLCPFLPRLQFDKKQLYSLLNFAKGMLGLPILTFIFMRTDVFVVGKLCSTTELGLYSMAYVLAQVPVETLTSILNNLVLPVFSKKQNDLDWINNSVSHLMVAISAICFPILIFLMCYGEHLLILVYGRPYGAVAVPFVIIFLSSMIRAMGVPIVQVYWALGLPSLNRKFTAIRAFTMLLIIAPAVKFFGLNGAAVSGLIAIMISIVFQLLQMKKMTSFMIINCLKRMLIFLGYSTIIIPVWLIGMIVFEDNFYAELIIGIFACISCFFFAAISFKRQIKRGFF